MRKYIQIDHKRIYLNAIASFEYMREEVEDGDIVDRTPVTPGKQFEDLKLVLFNGEEIEIEGKDAAVVAEVLEERSKNVGSF